MADRGSTTQGAAGGEQQTQLKRVMGPRLLLLFIVGDILGTGVYATTGGIAAEIGGAAWVPFLAAFVIALLTACSYLELVTKYPQAAGAALYTHKAFGIHFLTFIVAFTVMCSGITSASTASRLFAVNFNDGFALDLGGTGVLVIALAFMAVLGAINLRGVSDSVRLNVVLTLVEVSGLLLVIMIGIWAAFHGKADFSDVVVFDTAGDKNVFVAVTTATSLAFFSMVGFEDSVNMAEETKDPVRIFPKVMLTGLGITGAVYVLVSIIAVALVPVGELEAAAEQSIILVAQTGAPSLPIDEIYPFIILFAVSNSALINMLMASRLLYGMSRQRVLPPFLGKVHPVRQTPYAAIIFTTVLAFGLITYVVVITTRNPETTAIDILAGTTALLLLAVFAVVNIAVLVLRRDPVEGEHFRTPTIVAVVGALACAYLVTPLSGRPAEQYQVAGLLLGIGVVLWAITWFANRALRADRTFVRDPTDLSG